MLFKKQDFTSHAGLNLSWKIECDALDNEDYATLAYIVSKKYAFGKVVGIPRGGIPFADHLQHYVTPGVERLLIVDDVYTTGKSMQDTFLNECVTWDYPNDIVGVVVFARGTVRESWIEPMFQFRW